MKNIVIYLMGGLIVALAAICGNNAREISKQNKKIVHLEAQISSINHLVECINQTNSALILHLNNQPKHSLFQERMNRIENRYHEMVRNSK